MLEVSIFSVVEKELKGGVRVEETLATFVRPGSEVCEITNIYHYVVNYTILIV